MSDIRKALAQLLDGYATHLADLIEAEFLVVPRSGVVKTEYGWRRSPSDTNVGPRKDREAAVFTAENRGGEAVERPSVPWSVIPRAAVAPCSDCGLPDGRQDVCRTCHGRPIPEGGER